MKIYLDLDDTLSLLTMPLLDKYGVRGKYPVEAGYDIDKAAEIMGGRRVIQWYDLDILFWANLPVSPEAYHIVDQAVDAVGQQNVFICTAPCTPASAAGKLKWIAKHLPAFREQYVFTSHKYLLAHNSLLVDDKDDNVDLFRAYGGDAILVPRPWNSRHGEVLCDSFIDIG